MIAALYAGRTARRLTTFTVGFSDGEPPAARQSSPSARAHGRPSVRRSSRAGRERGRRPQRPRSDGVASRRAAERGTASVVCFPVHGVGVKVALTGTGADEVFGADGKWRALEGWPARTQMRRWRENGARGWAHLWSGRLSDRRSLHEGRRDASGPREAAECVPRSAADVRHRRLVPRIFFGRPGTDDVRDAATWADLNAQLAGAALPIADRFSMGHGVQARDAVPRPRVRAVHAVDSVVDSRASAGPEAASPAGRAPHASGRHRGRQSGAARICRSGHWLRHAPSRLGGVDVVGRSAAEARTHKSGALFPASSRPIKRARTTRARSGARSCSDLAPWGFSSRSAASRGPRSHFPTSRRAFEQSARPHRQVQRRYKQVFRRRRLLTNLFRGWPVDSLATVHGDSLPEDHSVCDSVLPRGEPTRFIGRGLSRCFRGRTGLPKARRTRATGFA